ncbi:hypothetical protein F4777DRAFT_598147 [Nemania sp. FL0916]|nr:hypothetical protein F4777DRAFT_598147 [Nemania sp. FL0916]
MSDLDFSHLHGQQLQDVLDAPAIEPPHDVLPDFEHPRNEDAVALAALTVCLTLSSIFIFIRVYVVFIKTRMPRIADYLMLLAYAFYVVVCSGSLVRLARVGLFIHQWDMHGRDIIPYLRTVLIGAEFWVVGILLLKASILLEWLRIFAPARSRNAFVISCWVLLAADILLYAAILVALNLTCRPFQKIWDKTLPGTCIDFKKIHLCAAIVNLNLNIAILILPQKIIWSLQMSRSNKVGVSTVFAIGFLATVASIFLLEATLRWNMSADMTYHYSGVALWAIAEMTCGILVFCVPFLPHLAQSLWALRWTTAATAFCRPAWIIRTESVPAIDMQNQPHTRISKPREYEEIHEPVNSPFRGYGSPRPTDQQYGISVTTDIVVSESYPRNPSEQSHLPWGGHAW